MITVTAENGTTVKTYSITINRDPEQGITSNNNLSGTKETIEKLIQKKPQTTEEPVSVHMALSLNGDGINDNLQIKGIASRPDNTLLIMDRNGEVVYRAKVITIVRYCSTGWQ